MRKHFKDLKILILTVFERNEKSFDAILAGADCYLLKQTAPIKLLDADQEVYGGGAPMTPAVARKVLQLFAKGGRPSAERSPIAPSGSRRSSNGSWMASPTR